MDDSEVLNLCLVKSFYPEVYKCLFGMIVYSSEDHLEFAERLWKVLLEKAMLVEHAEEYAENSLMVMQEISLCYEKLIGGVFVDGD